MNQTLFFLCMCCMFGAAIFCVMDYYGIGFGLEIIENDTDDSDDKEWINAIAVYEDKRKFINVTRTDLKSHDGKHIWADKDGKIYHMVKPKEIENPFPIAIAIIFGCPIESVEEYE